MNEQDFTPDDNKIPETPPEDKNEKKERKSPLLITACILSGISILLLLTTPILSMLALLLPHGDYPTPNPTPTVQGEDISDKVLDEAMDSTVIVMCGNSAGSGVIIRDDGYILTNYHVVSDGESLSVILREGERKQSASLVGYNERMDVAVLKIQISVGTGDDALRYAPAVIGSRRGAYGIHPFAVSYGV